MSTATSKASGSRSLPTSPSASAPAAENPDPHYPQRWLILGVIGVAQLMVILDASIVNIALPSAQHGLGFSDANRQWIITAYALAFGSLLLLGGRMSDLFGRKIAFMVGLVGFAAASALGGASVNFGMLVGARTAQGAFGALLAPAALALLTTTFAEGKDRGKAFGIFGALAGAGGAVGLLLGGILTEYLSWRWCMYVNLVFAGIAFVGAALLLHRQPQGTQRPQLDVPGALAASAGLFCIVFGFSNAATHSWGSPLSWGFLAGGTALLVVFVILQIRVAHPLLPMRVVLDRNRGGSYLAVLLIGIGIFGIFLFLTFYLQQNLRFSPIRTGVAFLPMVAAIMISATSSTAVLLPRFGPKPLVAIGMTAAAGGLFWLSFLQVSSTYAANVLPALLVTGLGIGLAMSPAMQTAIVGVRPSDAGVASATVNTMQQVGGSVGTALLATIAGHAAADYLSSRRPNPQVIAEAAVHSYTTAFTWGAAIFLVGAVICGCILRLGVLPYSQAGPLAAPAVPDTAPDLSAYLAPPAPATLQPAVFGHVLALDGSSLPAATLTLVDVYGGQIDRSRSGRDGSYRLHAPEAGNYLLICTAPPNRPYAERVVVGPQTASYDIVMLPQPDDQVPAAAGDRAVIG
ncbi:MAG: MFS transporter [Pseudonocardiaceae bacterium]